MRIFLLSFLFLMVGPVMAFNVGPTARPSFGSAEQQEEREAQQQKISFSATRYDASRWSKGVETKPVRTSTASTAVEETEPLEEMPKAGAKAATKKAAKVDQELVKGPKKPMAIPQAIATPSAKKGEQATPDQAAAVPADAATALSQIGQLQDMMQGLGALGGAASGGDPNKNAAGSMADLSKLMGGASTQPGKKL